MRQNAAGREVYDVKVVVDNVQYWKRGFCSREVAEAVDGLLHMGFTLTARDEVLLTELPHIHHLLELGKHYYETLASLRDGRRAARRT